MSCDRNTVFPTAKEPLPPPLPRQGMALVLVLAVLTLGLGLSFALLQSQTTQMFLQRNASHRDQARQAALSGVSAALQQIRHADWAGVDTSFEQVLGNGRSFRVSYAPGDDRLDPQHPDYWLWPYRVTISVTGYSEDPLNPQMGVEHTIRLVVQLVPEKLQPVPRAWTESLSYALYQRYHSTRRKVEVEVPCQIDGTVRFQDKLAYMIRYPVPQEAAARLAEDWNALRAMGVGDFRTFTSSIELPRNKQSADTLQLLQKLGVSLVDRPASSRDNWYLRKAITSYRLYPGGPVFQASQLPPYLQDTVLEPDPKTNPLGLFYRNGSVELGDNVRIHGTLLTHAFWNGNLRISGVNVVLEPVSMPPLRGEQVPVQLPAVILLQHLEVLPGATAEIRGAVYVSDRLRVKADSQAGIVFRVQGPVSVQRLDIRSRSKWDQGKGWWNATWDEFLQLQHPWFPIWLAEQHDLDSTPQIVLSGPVNTVHYHWPDAKTPLLDYPAPDQGLQWDLVRWEEFGP